MPTMWDEHHVGPLCALSTHNKFAALELDESEYPTFHESDNTRTNKSRKTRFRMTRDGKADDVEDIELLKDGTIP